MALDPAGVLIVLGLTLVIGYIGSRFYEKTKIPDVLWLIIFGILLGPVFQLTDGINVTQFAPWLGAFALILILFEAGLNIDFYQVVKGLSRSLGLAVLSTALTTIAIGAIAHYVFNLPWLMGLLLGAVLGGTSSPVVLSIMNRVNIRLKVKTLLNLESILTDPLVIVISIALLQYIAQVQGSSPLQSILGAFSIGAVLGGVIGLVWLFILDKLKDQPYDYMVTLAVLFLVYGISEMNGGSGAIATLLFGIVLGNSVTFSRMLKFKKTFRVDRLLKVFQSELSFFIKAAFFVFLGLIFIPNTEFILFGLVISAAIIILRLLATRLATHGMNLTKTENRFVNIMIPRGLAAAVLAQFPTQPPFNQFIDQTTATLFSSVVLIVILTTILYSVIMSRIFTPKEAAPAEQPIANNKSSKKDSKKT